MKKASSVYASKTDVEVIDIYKNNCHWRTKQDIEAYFYQKYTPLCKKYSFKYKYLSTFEDNMQDCYFQMIQALEYVDTNKITDLEKYSFGVTFVSYLSSHFIAEIKKYKNSGEEMTKELPTINIQPTPGIASDYVTEGEKFLNSSLCNKTQENDIIFNMYKAEFEGTLPEKELRLFQMLADGMKKKDIVKELGEKHTANLTFWINKIQKRYVEFNNSIGYEITI